MAKDFENIQIVCKKPTKELFEDCYRESGANSKGEFISWLLEKFTTPDEVKTIEKTIEVAAKLPEDTIPLKLTKAQRKMFENMFYIKACQDQINYYLEKYNEKYPGIFPQIEINEAGQITKEEMITKYLIFFTVARVVNGGGDYIPIIPSKSEVREIAYHFAGGK